MGNDWLTHVVAGSFFYLEFGKIGLMGSFLSHFFIDLIPHGHHKKEWPDTIKGSLVGIGITIYWFDQYGWKEAFWIGLSIALSVSYDFVGTASKFFDKKRWFKRFNKIVLLISLYTHWFVWENISNKLNSGPTKVETFDCLPGKKFHPWDVGWFNLFQPAIILIIIATYYTLRL
jgi:hypothetical protein